VASEVTFRRVRLLQAAVSEILGVCVSRLTLNEDRRGSLVEAYRTDELQTLFIGQPQMAYISATLGGVVRGPHVHKYQTDMFVFLGPEAFELYLWKESAPGIIGKAERMVVRPCWRAVIPPGVIHAYKNIGTELSLVFNLPDRLYKGINKQHPVDEIRYEDDPDSPFQVPTD